MPADEPQRADTAVSPLVRVVPLTGRAIAAVGRRAAGVQCKLAVLARKPRRAGAGVGSLARVSASATVLARPVVRAEVEVLVAEKAAPALHAVALPGLRAGAMQAAGVPCALFARWTLPANPAAVCKKQEQA